MIDGGDPGRVQQAVVTGQLTQPSMAALRVAAEDPRDTALAAAYRYLQRAVGVIAVLLPLTVAVGSAVLGGGGVRGSISDYYYSPAGNVFVGSLCALAVFFLSYNYRPLPKFELDNTLSKFASLAALGVALLPTASDKASAVGGARVVSFLHMCFASALFVLLAVFSLLLFTRTDHPDHMTAQKRRRNRLYRVCGGLIVAAIVLIVVTSFLRPPAAWDSLFWLETVCVVAFGVSWLVKGGFLGILADPAPAASTPPPATLTSATLTSASLTAAAPIPVLE